MTAPRRGSHRSSAARVRSRSARSADCGEPGMFSGAWIDRIIGLEKVTVEVVMVCAPTAATCSRWCASTRPPPGLMSWRRACRRARRL